MATIELVVSVHWRWWVRPLMYMAWLFAFVMQPWMDDDDLDRLIAGLSAFIAKRGIVLRSPSGKRF